MDLGGQLRPLYRWKYACDRRDRETGLEAGILARAGVDGDPVLAQLLCLRRVQPEDRGQTGGVPAHVDVSRGQLEPHGRLAQ